MNKFFKKEYKTGLIVGLLLMVFLAGILLMKNFIWQRNAKSPEIEMALTSDGNFAGKVETNDNDHLVIQKYDGNQQVFTVGDSTLWKIYNEKSNGYEEIDRDRMIVGDDVWVVAKKGETGLWSAVVVGKEMMQKIAGMVVASSDGVIKIEDFTGKNYDVVGNKIEVSEKPTGKILKIEDIEIGDNISALGKFDAMWSKFNATKIEVVLE